MFLFIARLLNIPVPAADIFGRDLPEGELGQVLDGDPAVPPTFVQGRWAFLNPIRNAFLAMFIWKTYSVMDLGSRMPRGAYLMFGNGAVMPRAIFSRFIIVKHGREACRFIVADAQGCELHYRVIGRGDQHFVIDAAYHVLRSEFWNRGLRRDDLGRALNEMNSSELYTFV